MSTSDIKFRVHLDKDNVPEKIEWDADQKDVAGWSETKSISVALWDEKSKNTLRIDLWTKDMPVLEMKRFYIDCLGGLAQSVLNSTGDQVMSGELNDMCERLVQHVKNEEQ